MGNLAARSRPPSVTIGRRLAAGHARLPYELTDFRLYLHFDRPDGTADGEYDDLAAELLFGEVLVQQTEQFVVGLRGRSA